MSVTHSLFVRGSKRTHFRSARKIMPKRKAEDKITFYREKIRKLEERRKPRRRIIISSSDDDEIMEERQPDQTHENSTPTENEVSNETSENSIDQTQNLIVTPDPLLLEGDPDLDPELLSALGESTSDSPDFGVKILESQAKLWLPILKKGMPKESKENLLKEYNIPDNCRLLQAPKLNAEIAAAIPDMKRNRDKN